MFGRKPDVRWKALVGKRVLLRDDRPYRRGLFEARVVEFSETGDSVKLAAEYLYANGWFRTYDLVLLDVLD